MLAHFFGIKNSKESKPEPPPKDAVAPADTDQLLPPPPVPEKRPGTSGTELNLRTHRVEAATAFQRAQRAEQDYRAKRQATIARTDIKAAKSHLSEAGSHLKAGCMAGFGAVRLMPAVYREKKTVWREKREREKKERGERVRVEKERREELEKKLREKEERERKEGGGEEVPVASGGNGDGKEGGAAAAAEETPAA